MLQFLAPASDSSFGLMLSCPLFTTPAPSSISLLLLILFCSLFFPYPMILALTLTPDDIFHMYTCSYLTARPSTSACERRMRKSSDKTCSRWGNISCNLLFSFLPTNLFSKILPGRKLLFAISACSQIPAVLPLLSYSCSYPPALRYLELSPCSHIAAVIPLLLDTSSYPPALI